jgi:hypothetical protein
VVVRVQRPGRVAPVSAQGIGLAPAIKPLRKAGTELVGASQMPKNSRANPVSGQGGAVA